MQINKKVWFILRKKEVSRNCPWLSPDAGINGWIFQISYYKYVKINKEITFKELNKSWITRIQWMNCKSQEKDSNFFKGNSGVEKV